MLERIQDKQKIPKIKNGDVVSVKVSINHIEETHILYVYREQSCEELKMVSLNHRTCVWDRIESWWNTDKNEFYDIEVLPKGTAFKIV